MMRVALGIRSHFVNRLPEWLLATEMGAEGWQLLRTGETFRSTRAYSVLIDIVSERTMGLIAVFLAAFWLLALFLNGTFISFRRISPWIRSVSAFAAGFYWMVFTVGMAIGNPIGTGVINNAGFAALAMAYSIITAREVGAMDRDATRWRRRNQQT